MPHDDKPIGKVLTRRETISLVGAAGLTSFLSGCAPALTARASGKQDAKLGGMVNCVTAMPAATAGPFWNDVKLKRVDIMEDRKGHPLTLKINLVAIKGEECRAIENAVIDIWHCDGAGRYSGEPSEGTDGETWCRGHQITDEEGAATFRTIYPGWYRGRAVHIHFRVRFELDGKAFNFASQAYFDDKLSDQIFEQSPYKDRPNRDMLNERDFIYQQEFRQAERAIHLGLTKTKTGHTATFHIGMVVPE